ncbi:MAG: carboxypeptidase-like regulatory domain-containing protein, partial [Bacteroidota bacterium]|nr:carboxypeptidase-like regulatory domain-containing protein [Bacteroidota bacterium]
MILFLIIIPLMFAFSQQDKRSIITGRLLDEETNQPLENVIIFLSNTPIGTSSGIDGTFRIANIPIGTYELVFSRIGYERQIIPLQIVKDDSLYFEIKSKPQPVRTKEVEILGERLEEAKPYLNLFFPQEMPGVYCIYGKISSIPIGILFTDSAFYMYSIETTVIDSQKYIQLWLLYKNLSETPYDINPMKYLRLHVKGKTLTAQEIPPSFPAIIIPALDTQKIVSRILETFGVTLEALATKQSVFEWELHHSDLLFTMSPRPAILRPSKFNPAREGSLSATLYNIFQNSVNVGIMQRYLVFPENSINGYIYFP